MRCWCYFELGIRSLFLPVPFPARINTWSFWFGSPFQINAQVFQGGGVVKQENIEYLDIMVDRGKGGLWGNKFT